MPSKTGLSVCHCRWSNKVLLYVTARLFIKQNLYSASIHLSFVCYFFTLTSSSCVGLRIELSIHPFNRSRISKLLNQVVRVVCSSLPKEVVLCCCCCSILLVFFVDHFYYFWCRLSSVRFDFIYVCFRVLFLYSFHMLLWSVCLSDSIAADIHTF